MILLDTNIISEMMKTSPSEKVINWFDQLDALDLFISTITISEISYGINVYPKGKRRQQLENAFHKTVTQGFKHRILSFDETSAYCYGKIMSHRKSIGKPISTLDGQIASIALANSTMIATRNVSDFEYCDIEIINPFS